MPQAVPYVPATDFSGYATSNPSATFNGALLDDELAAVQETTDDLRTNAALIQRDDGRLANGSVHPEALDVAAKLLFSGGAINPSGFWLTASSYAKLDLVEEGSATYVATVAHVSGVFATDRAAGKWLKLFEAPPVVPTFFPATTYKVIGANCACNAIAPTSAFDMDADVIVLRSPATGETVVRTDPAVIVCDTTVSGPVANGRDQSAAFAASTWLHFYWIWNPSSSTLATTVSIVAPPTGPALPSGYTMWTYAGAVRFNGSSQLVRTYIKGARAYYATQQSALSGGSSTSEAVVSVSSLVPPNALDLTALVDMVMSTDGSGVAQGSGIIRVLTGSNFYTHSFGGVSGLSLSTAVGVPGAASIMLPNIGQQFVYLVIVTTGSAPSFSVWVSSYSIPNGG